ncbi:hypothetical protein DJ46_5851 (plasmid) [Bacillus anthracis str. Vollum]|nr:hypothetical protein DJ46_5851 [Bacillus anthracis str. Vollum]AJG79715.1 hypothetical protein BF39_5872 [Bacillus anthracis]AJH26154.1 hypothetical protein BF31_5889 [Bacillus anthracis]
MIVTLYCEYKRSVKTEKARINPSREDKNMVKKK